MKSIVGLFIILFAGQVSAQSISCTLSGATVAERTKLSSGGYGFCEAKACSENLELSNGKCVNPPTPSWFTKDQSVERMGQVISLRAQLSRLPVSLMTAPVSVCPTTLVQGVDYEIDSSASFTSQVSNPISLTIKKTTSSSPAAELLVKVGVESCASPSAKILKVSLAAQNVDPLVLTMSWEKAQVLVGESNRLILHLNKPISRLFPSLFTIDIGGEVSSLTFAKNQTDLELNITRGSAGLVKAALVKQPNGIKEKVEASYVVALPPPVVVASEFVDLILNENMATRCYPTWDIAPGRKVNINIGTTKAACEGIHTLTLTTGNRCRINGSVIGSVPSCTVPVANQVGGTNKFRGVFVEDRATVIVQNTFSSSSGKFYFSASKDQVNFKAYVSDGTVSGTFPLLDIEADNSIVIAPNYWTEIGGLVYFVMGDNLNPDHERLYSTDGTRAGTQMVNELDGVYVGGGVRSMQVFKNGLLIEATTAADYRNRAYYFDGQNFELISQNEVISARATKDYVVLFDQPENVFRFLSHQEVLDQAPGITISQNFEENGIEHSAIATSILDLDPENNKLSMVFGHYPVDGDGSLLRQLALIDANAKTLSIIQPANTVGPDANFFFPVIDRYVMVTVLPSYSTQLSRFNGVTLDAVSDVNYVSLHPRGNGGKLGEKSIFSAEHVNGEYGVLVVNESSGGQNFIGTGGGNVTTFQSATGDLVFRKYGNRLYTSIDATTLWSTDGVTGQLEVADGKPVEAYFAEPAPNGLFIYRENAIGEMGLYLLPR